MMTESESGRQLRVEKIREGTVIDHITSGTALAVLRILNISGREGFIVSILMNVPSKKLGKKDIVKIEGREISPKEVAEIALVAPKATINIIRDFNVIKKEKVKLPSIVKDIIKCPNQRCITNSQEPVKQLFYVENEDPVVLRCHYCNVLIEKDEIIKQFYKG
ncbi:MAG: aspartate carbamoyltransferase regulatory subunit [Candidatus Bathyarchaeota archaeon]|nr:aspartate carbamoyltransferase regulatory subunit [Candidatus Bathyarchaeota archaeon]